MLPQPPNHDCGLGQGILMGVLLPSNKTLKVPGIALLWLHLASIFYREL